MDSNIKKYFQTYIQTNEGGFHSEVYLDTKGIATIGYGTNLTTDFVKSYITNTLKYNYQEVLSGKQVITIDDANSLFQSSYDIAFKDASKFISNFDSLSPERQLILVDMSYNLGSKLKNFVNLKSAIEQGDWEKASNEILNSKYASDVKSRADRNAEVMKNGISEYTDEYLKEHNININSLSDTVKQIKENESYIDTNMPDNNGTTILPGIEVNQDDNEASNDIGDKEQYIKDAEYISENGTDITQKDVDNSVKYTDSGEIKSDGTTSNSENEKVENNTQSNLEKLDEITSTISTISQIAPDKLAPFIGFLSSNPAALTSFALLVDKINNGTATSSDYVHAITSLGGVAAGVADLVLLGVRGTPMGLMASLTIAVTLFAVDRYGAEPSKFIEDWEFLADTVSNAVDDLKEIINSSNFSDIEKNNFINMLPRIEMSFGSNDSAIAKVYLNGTTVLETIYVKGNEIPTPKAPITPDEYDAQIKDVLGMIETNKDIMSAKDMIPSLQNAPKSMLAMKEVLLDKGENELAQWITDDGKFKENTPEYIKEKAYLEAQEDNALAKKLGVSNVPEDSLDTFNKSIEEQRIKVEIEHKKWLEENEGNALSTKLGSSIGGGIGSIIIANNDYSNIEKIAISTSTTVVGQNVGEYIFWDKNGTNGTGAFGDIATDYKNTLQGAVVSFAISSFFAKNDNIADIIGMDGTFVGGLVDSTAIFTAGYAINSFIGNYKTVGDIGKALSQTTESITSLSDAFAGALGVAVGGYLGNALANEIMNWDTKEEALGASIGSSIGIAIALWSNPATFWLGVLYSFGGSFVGNIIGGIVGGLFGKKSPPPPKAHAKYEFDEEDESYNLVSSSSSHGGNEKAMIDIGKSLANHFENMFKLPGGQLVDASMLPDIQVKQKNKTVTINGKSGSFSDVNDILSHLLVDKIPFINVENGDEYILRALNRTNEKFQEEDINAYKGRGDLEELYENISLASDYSKYKNETVVLVDKNGNLITDATKLQEINTLFQIIQAISDETQKEKALKEFLEEYNFVSQKDYVDKLLKENNPLKQDEIDHWKKVFEKVEELQLDTHHYSEDFNKLNTLIDKYNYQQSELNGELVDIDYDKYFEEITQKMLKIYNEDASNPLTKEENPKGLTKDEAKAILEEIGSFYSYDNAPFANDNFGMNFIYEKEINISPIRFAELLEMAGIENPYENIKPIEDAFSFKGKSLNDLLFKLEDGKLYIKTFDKDLSSDEASELSKTFVIDNFTKWDKTNTHIELPDGTKVNLQALLETIGVKEGVGFVDVNEAFLEILGKNETIEQYLKDYDSNNVYVGTSKGDTIKAYFGDNLIVTGTGNNTIVTGAGDDIVFAHNGKNDISLGLGNDTVSYELNDSAIYASLESGSSSKGDTLTDVENLHGSKYNDILEGDSKDNTLLGGAGDDILIGLDGADTLNGGDGIDLASYETSSAVEINLKHNYADGGEATGDKFINIEGIKGSKESDTIVGDNNSNLIYANTGDDRVSGNGGDDIIFGGLGNDYIKGDEGNDTLYGEDGDDILIGGAGDDILVGGTGKNMLYGDSGTDTVLYKGKSTDYEVLIVNENTLFVKSKDGKTLDTLRDIEELAFDDAVFKIDYENKTLIKKVVFENKEDEKQNEPLEDSQSNQAATIATAIMLGTVAAAQTQESSTDEMNYLSDDPASLENLANAKEIEVPTLTKDNPLYDIAQKIKEYNNNKNINSSILDNSVSTDDRKDEIYQIETTKELTNEENQEKKEENNKIDIVTPQIIVQEKEIISEFTVTVENSVEDESLDPLIAAQITLDQIEINEDNNLYGIKISDLNNFTTTLEVVFIGLPDKFLLSAGEKRADGNWYLTQNDLKDLYMIPQTNNSDDFDLTIKAIVSDTHGRVTISTLVQTITIVAVADTPNLEVLDSRGDEDTAIVLNIETSLVDDLGGVDGEESIYLTIENVPSEAVLSKGIKKEDGIWYLLPEDLKDLTITPKLNDADDFTIKVTAYSTESENGDVVKISKDIFVKVDAVADTPNLEVLDSRGDEDTAIVLNIETSLVDDLGGVDGEESIYLTIENVPSEAVLSKGIKKEDGIWYLLPEDLKDLTITPKLNDADDFTIKVTAYSTESENGDV
ncbi:glycoside hydrolase family protein, partial [Aliarcobacter butzleri]|uniref:glycoside hydrolase family protein n=1 Tax=Aliarcobacter butzleri TaxID=28197 RepID=UPI003851448B